MPLSRFGYYLDFFVYPILLVVLAIAGTRGLDGQGVMVWAIAYLAALGVWTLLEYLLHRFVLHRVPVLRDMHGRHHLEEDAYDGTPTWVSLAAFAVFAFLPAWLLSDLMWATAITGGLMTGYLWYITVHHIVHHWHFKRPGYAYNLRRQHALHHHFDQTANYGVTSNFWDRIFGTKARTSARSRTSARQGIAAPSTARGQEPARHRVQGPPAE